MLALPLLTCTILYSIHECMMLFNESINSLKCSWFWQHYFVYQIYLLSPIFLFTSLPVVFSCVLYRLHCKHYDGNRAESNLPITIAVIIWPHVRCGQQVLAEVMTSNWVQCNAEYKLAMMVRDCPPDGRQRRLFWLRLCQTPVGWEPHSLSPPGHHLSPITENRISSPMS